MYAYAYVCDVRGGSIIVLPMRARVCFCVCVTTLQCRILCALKLKQLTLAIFSSLMMRSEKVHVYTCAYTCMAVIMRRVEGMCVLYRDRCVYVSTQRANTWLSWCLILLLHVLLNRIHSCTCTAVERFGHHLYYSSRPILFLKST